MVIQVGKLNSVLQSLSQEKTQLIFENGVSWQLPENKQEFVRVDNQQARVIYQNGVCYLQIEGVDDLLEVARKC